MAIEKIDVNIKQVVTDAQVKAQKEQASEDGADAARKAAEKKIVAKKAALKNLVVKQETFQRTGGRKEQINQVLGGAAGQEPADALRTWNDNGQLQSKLSDAQKRLFQDAITKDPAKGAKTAQAMERLTQKPTVEKTVDSKQMGIIQKALIEDPTLEKPASQLLESRFMQSKKADPQTRSEFLKFGLDQAKKGGTDFKLGSVKHAGDMLGSLVNSGMPKGAQRAAMKMVEKQPQDTGAMSNVDTFASDSNVSKMPSFARGKATELLAKSGGKADVSDGFQKLAGDPDFQKQTADNKGRFFATIGSGNASEYRAMTDKSLQVLQSNDFPARSGQVSKLLQKMSSQAKSGGAKSINAKGLIKEAKSSPMPTPPKMLSTEGLSEEEAQQVRAQNRGNTIKFYTQLQRQYEKVEKKLNSARYLEDVNKLQNLRDPPSIDESVLTPDEQQFLHERRQSVKSKLQQVKKLQRQKSRELRGRRMPPAKRRALAAQRRVKGRQEKYFNPNAGRTGGAAAFSEPTVQPGSLPKTPQQAGRTGQASQGPGAAGTGDIQSQVASALSQLGDGPMTAEKAGQVAQTIASNVASQVASQVAQQLMGGAGKAAPSASVADAEAAAEAKNVQKGQVDGWGIPRTFERDLGGARRAPVKPVVQQGESGEDSPSMAEVANEKYTGRALVKDPGEIRTMSTLIAAEWKSLSRPETALLRNLGWNQQLWATRHSPNARWPMAMATSFVNLSPTQREAVRQLGFTAHDWDTRVQAFSTGKNA